MVTLSRKTTLLPKLSFSAISTSRFPCVGILLPWASCRIFLLSSPPTFLPALLPAEGKIGASAPESMMMETGSPYSTSSSTCVITTLISPTFSSSSPMYIVGHHSNAAFTREVIPHVKDIAYVKTHSALV